MFGHRGSTNQTTVYPHCLKKSLSLIVKRSPFEHLCNLLIPGVLSVIFYHSDMTPIISVICSTSLPPELWRIVLHYLGTTHEDLVFLWKTCRHVSRYFRREVEEFYVTNALPTFRLYLDITTSIRKGKGLEIAFQDSRVGVSFNRVSEDRMNATFAADNTNDRENVKQLGNKSSQVPIHTLQLSSPISNGILPSLVVSNEGEVAFNWKAYVTAFLTRAQYSNSNNKNEVRSSSRFFLRFCC